MLETPAQLRLHARRQMAEQSEVGGDAVALGRIVRAPQFLQPAIVAVAEQGGDEDRRRRRTGQISTWLPSSTTRLGGSLKNSIALSALRSIQPKSCSRQTGMPRLRAAIRVWRERKKLVSIILMSRPQLTVASAAGRSLSSMKPKRRISRKKPSPRSVRSQRRCSST